ncbi:MAG TPA: MBL fold metallo-hydrolase [bacterium]|nr:MBL fold metallo-hydrolase [bacterium]
MNQRVMLQPVDAVDVTIVVDNFLDVLMPSTEMVRRAPLVWDWAERDTLVAEHGYSLLVTVRKDDRTESLLFDAGLGRETAIHNLDVLGVRISDLRTVALSHGHVDHHGGLEGIFRRVGRQRMPLVLHPDAWRDRKIVFPTGTEIRMPPPNRSDLEREGVEVVEERGPSLLLDGMVLVTGQVERVTDFEKGFPLQHARTQDGWEPDTWLWDDQPMVLNLKDKGLVVLSCCSHAGIINVLRHAQRMTGQEKVYAVIGGLHLTGGIFEPIIPRTLDELVAIGPEVVVPCHCTGWKATHELARRLPGAYVQTSVGTRLHFV